MHYSNSEAEVNSNKKLRCRYVEADYKHEASRGLSVTAELLVIIIPERDGQTDRRTDRIAIIALHYADAR